MLPKKLSFKDTHHKISVPLAMSTNLDKKVPDLKKKREKIAGQMLGQDQPENTPAKCLFRRGEIPSPRQTSIDQTNECIMKSEWGALFRGSDPPSGRSVHNTAGDTWRAPARRLIQTHWALMCRKQRTKILDPSPMPKNRPSSGLGEERRTPRATSRPLDHGST